jgi:hypothetical protein
MTSAVIAVPYLAPDPGGDSNWGRLQMTWTGWDGSVWDLTNPDLGVFMRKEGIRGLGMPKVEHHRDRSPALPGAFHRDLNYDIRDVFWPLQVFHDGSSAEWIKRDRAFWRTMRPHETGRWTVTQLDGSSRYLDLRFDDDGDWAPEVDPTFFGWANYGVRLTAEHPFWRGEPVRRSWATVEPVDYFADAPNVYAISSSRSVSTATVVNHGDADSYPIWRAHGPMEGVGITVDGHVLELGVELAEGESRTLNAAPDEQTCLDENGNDCYGDLTVDDWGGFVPPNEVPTPIDIVIGGTGEGRVELELPISFLRAW